MAFQVRMVARDVDEAHRSATPLELFFDLAFVVAIAQAAAGLHHGIVEGHADTAVVSFLLVFFGIWWAWMNFTWFASAYDTDDGSYRIAVFVVMTGVLVMAAGIPRAFANDDFDVVTGGYVIMRVALVALWLRAAYSVVENRRCALRYAIGISVLQVLWVVRLWLPEEVSVHTFLVLIAGELAVPLWAESVGRTSWHPGHIAERYGLFTIIVLGESVLAATIGVQAALDADASFMDLASVIVGGLLLVFSMWWLYFDMPAEALVRGVRGEFSEHLAGAFLWGYGHYVVFASVAATGAGLVVNIEQVTGEADISRLSAGLALTIPASIYLLAVWILHLPLKRSTWVRNYSVPVGVLVILAASWSPRPVLVTGVVVAVLVAIGQVTRTSLLRPLDP
jgi:low temperature requirement protein LtrA